MKTEAIKIVMQDVYDIVQKQSAHIGAADMYAGNAGSYERVYASDMETKDFQLYYTESLNALAALMGKYLSSVTQTATGSTIEVYTPSSFSATGIQLQNAIENYLAYSILADWLAIVSPQRAEYDIQKKQQTAAVVRTMLSCRKRPGRAEPPSIKDNENATYE